MLSVLYLLLGMLPCRTHLSLYLLIPGFVLYHLVSIVPLGSITQRLSIIALALARAVFCLTFLSVLRKGHVKFSETLRLLMVRGLHLGLLLYAVGLVSSFVGNMTLGALLVLATANAIFAGIVLWLLTLILRVIVRVALVTDVAYRLAVAPEHSEIILQRLFPTITFVTGALWVMFTLRGFELCEPFMRRITSVLRASRLSAISRCHSAQG